MSATPPSILILGGRSEIGLAIARRFARDGAHIVLAARSVERLERVAESFRDLCGHKATLLSFDVLDLEIHAAFLDALAPFPDIVVCAIGLDIPQGQLAADPSAALRVVNTNYVAPALLLGEIANRMEARGSGAIIGLSSVAGDRGRAANYTYGSAKAGFTAFLSGLRARLAKRGVRVITVKPGFVDTRMLGGRRTPPALTATADEVALAAFRAHRGRRDVIYVRAIWRPLTAIIRILPERLFRRFAL